MAMSRPGLPTMRFSSFSTLKLQQLNQNAFLILAIRRDNLIAVYEIEIKRGF